MDHRSHQEGAGDRHHAAGQQQEAPPPPPRLLLRWPPRGQRGLPEPQQRRRHPAPWTRGFCRGTRWVSLSILASISACQGSAVVDGSIDRSSKARSISGAAGSKTKKSRILGGGESYFHKEWEMREGWRSQTELCDRRVCPCVVRNPRERGPAMAASSSDGMLVSAGLHGTFGQLPNGLAFR